VSVRSKAKGEYLRKLYEKDGYGKDRFSFVIVEDIAKEGAFDEAVVGVDAVEHTASPVTLTSNTPDDIIGPALSGTKGILESIKKHGHNVKRVVLTSSFAAIVTPKKPAPGQELATLDESDWNDSAVKDVEAKGNDAGGFQIYRASKVLAERAAWDFVKDNKGSIKFDLVTICPPMVYGPIIHEVSSASALGASIALWFNYLSNPEKSEKELVAPSNTSGYWADVRDVSAIHALAIGNPKAGGERFIVASGPNAWQDWLDIVHVAKPGRTDIPVGYPGKGKDVKLPAIVSTTKVREVFNHQFRTAEETGPATIDALRERGF